jgi:hypothetical protein
MSAGLASGRPVLFACALAAFFFLASINPAAARRAAELGPEAPLTEPSGGYVGQLAIAPQRGPAGTPLVMTGEGFPPAQEFDLVWRTVKGAWKVANGEYHGREYTPVAYRVATVKSDQSGRIEHRFAAPEDFGFWHDVVLQQGKRLLSQTAFHLDMTARLAGAASGPAGTPIAIEVQGIGWRELEGSWVLLYDNKFTGFLSAVTTGGTARFTIPASGHAGRHIVEFSIRISARRTAIPSSHPCRIARISGSISPSRRVRRCCPRRPGSRRRRRCARFRRRANWLPRGLFPESGNPRWSPARASRPARPTGSTGTRSSATA